MDEDCLIEAAMAAMAMSFRPPVQLQLQPLRTDRQLVLPSREPAKQHLEAPPKRRLVLIKKGPRPGDCSEQDLQGRNESTLVEGDFAYRSSTVVDMNQMCVITFPCRNNLFQFGAALWMPPILYHTLHSSAKEFLGEVHILSREASAMKHLWKSSELDEGRAMLIAPSLAIGVVAEIFPSSCPQPMVFVSSGPTVASRASALHWTVVSPTNIFECGPQQLADIVTNMNSERSRRKGTAEPLGTQDGSPEPSVVTFGSQEYLGLVARRQVASMLQRASTVPKHSLRDLDGDVDVAFMRREYPALVLIRKESLEGEVMPQMVAMCENGRIVSVNSGKDVRVDRQWFGCKTLIASLISDDELSTLSSVEAAALHAAQQFDELSFSANNTAGKFATSFDKTMNILKSIDVVSNCMSPKGAESLIRTVLALARCGFPYLITTARGQSLYSGSSFLDKMLISCVPVVLWYFLFHPNGKNESEAEEFCVLCGAATSLRPCSSMTSRSATKRIVEIAEQVTHEIRCSGPSPRQPDDGCDLELNTSLLHMYQSIVPNREGNAQHYDIGDTEELKEIDLSFDDEELSESITGPPLPKYVVQRCKASGNVKIVTDRREIRAIVQRLSGGKPDKLVSGGPCSYCQYSLGHKLCECPAYVANICRLRQGLRVLPAIRRDDTLAGTERDNTEQIQDEECDGNVVIQLDVPTAHRNKKRRRKEAATVVDNVVTATQEKKRQAAEEIRDTGVMLRTRSKAIDRRLAQRRSSIWVDMLSETFNHIPNTFLPMSTKSKIVGLVSLMSGETADDWRKTIEDITRIHCGIDNEVIVAGIFATFRDEMEKNRKELTKLGFELQ